MKKPGRNDPCPCGSGKKYKQCCLSREEAQADSDRSKAVPKALDWLMARHGRAVREALDEEFFGGLEDDEYDRLQEMDPESYRAVMVNAMEWLLAEGSIAVQGKDRRVSELLLGRGGPLFSAEQRQWIELLSARPLRLYEVVDVVHGERLFLRDVLVPDGASVVVKEKSGSERLVRFDLIAARIMPVGDHFELSGAIYPLPRDRGLELTAGLKEELEGVEPGSAEAKEILSVIIPDYWLALLVAPFQMPRVVDHVTGEPLLLITDHYRVEDWPALEQALSRQPDVEGNREEGWERLFKGEDGLLRNSARIDPGTGPDRMEASYRTQKYADQGRPWLEALAGRAVAFVTREIAAPEGLLRNLRPSDAARPSPPAQSVPPEVMTEIIEERIHQLYRDWVDQPLPALDDRTPRQAIQTREGLEQVKFLLHSYEHGEARQARDQHRTAVSYDFLWRELGITP